jgi:hypothetical protein
MCKPTCCPHCDFESVVPIVYGSPAPELYDAEILNFVFLAGSDAVQEGNALWHCANCGEAIPDQIYTSLKGPCYEAYLSEIRRLLSRLPSLTEDKRRCLKGEKWLKVIARKYLGMSGLLEVFLRQDALNSYCTSDSSGPIQEGDRIAGAYCFSQVRHFLEKTNGSAEIVTNHLADRVIAHASLSGEAISVKRCESDSLPQGFG